MDKESLIRYVLQELPMSRDRVELLVSKFVPMEIAKNEFILKAGMVCDRGHFVESGLLRSFIYDLEGNEVTTAFYSKDGHAADLLSFFRRIRTKEYIQAITDCETWCISYADMQSSFHALPEFREFGRLNIVKQYGILKERMLSALQETAEQRYNDLIESSPEIFQHVPLKYIASYLGITDTSLSRIRKEFIKK